MILVAKAAQLQEKSLQSLDLSLPNSSLFERSSDNVAFPRPCGLKKPPPPPPLSPSLQNPEGQDQMESFLECEAGLTTLQQYNGGRI